MTTKLEIIGPYTSDHEGPYTMIGPMLPNEDYLPITVHCVIDGIAFVTSGDVDTPWTISTLCIRNAREVPVAREFWVNEFKRADGIIYPLVRQSDHLAKLTERDAEIARKDAEIERLWAALEGIEVSIDALPDDNEDYSRMSAREMQRQALEVVKAEVKALKGPEA